MLFQLGPYRIVCELPPSYGGSVYEAFDQAHSRKVMLTQCPTTWAAEDILQRLELEARTSALLHHPNIARVLGFVRRDEHVYLVTELVQGITLEKILNERRKMPPALAITLFRQIMSGMATAHRLGVVHGDLRPANVVVPDFGPVKIANLAFAHAFRKGSQVEGNATSRYMAPEQLRGESPDVRSDIYSLGLMLYEAIAGKVPFDCHNDPALGSTAQRQSIPAAPSLSSDVPKKIDELLLQMIAPEPARRFQSIDAVTRFLDSALGAPEHPELRISNRGRLPARTAAHSRPRFAISPKWASAAVFFVLIGAEMLLFRGENISELMKKKIPPGPSLNDSVDAMFSRIGTESSAVDSEPTRELGAVAVRKPARRESRSGESVSARAERPSIAVETRFTRPAREAPVIPQNPSVTPPQRRAGENVNLHRETNIASAEVIHREAPEARDPARSIQNNAPLPRLRVEWEN